MQPIIKIGGNEVEIELTCEQEKQISELCRKEYRIDYDGAGYSLFNGAVEKANCFSSLNLENGVYRKTKELVQRKIKTDKEKNRLEELVHWLEPDWIPDWNDTNQKMYYINYRYDTEKFKTDYFGYTKTLGTVYMSKETARKITNLLNNGTLPELAEILKG